MVRSEEGERRVVGGAVWDAWVCPDSDCLTIPTSTQEGKMCVCCPSVTLLRPCQGSGQELKVTPNSTCDEARMALKVSLHAHLHHSSSFPTRPLLGSSQAEPVGFNPPRAPLTSPFLPQNLLFSVCGLTIFAAIICTLSAIVCCLQIFSLDLVHTVREGQGQCQAGMMGAGTRVEGV